MRADAEPTVEELQRKLDDVLQQQNADRKLVRQGIKSEQKVRYAEVNEELGEKRRKQLAEVGAKYRRRIALLKAALACHEDTKAP